MEEQLNKRSPWSAVAIVSLVVGFSGGLGIGLAQSESVRTVTQERVKVVPKYDMAHIGRAVERMGELTRSLNAANESGNISKRQWDDFTGELVKLREEYQVLCKDLNDQRGENERLLAELRQLTARYNSLEMQLSGK